MRRRDRRREQARDRNGVQGPLADGCLLYTSDAADERSSVDLGGRRIIKKKKNEGDEEERGHSKKIRQAEESKTHN